MGQVAQAPGFKQGSRVDKMGRLSGTGDPPRQERNRQGFGRKLPVSGLTFLASLILAVPGCGPPRTPYPASLQSEDPGERIRALKQAAERNDHEVLGIIVDRLEDEDEAVRMFAILALEKMTGTRLGYRYHATPAERHRMAEAWRRYLRENGAKLAVGSEGQEYE